MLNPRSGYDVASKKHAIKGKVKASSLKRLDFTAMSKAQAKVLLELLEKRV
jgi:hypothetical protein